MHHLLINTASNTNGAVDADTAAITDDPSFTIRGSPNHWIFTERWTLIAAATFGASLTRMRISSPTLDTFGQPQLVPLNRSLNPQTPFNEIDLRWRPFPLPLDEEVKVLLSNNLGAASEQETTALFIAPPDWTFSESQTNQEASSIWSGQLATPGFNLMVRTSQSVTLVANDWSLDTNLSFDQLPRGGWYGVLGAECEVTNGQVFALLFPRLSVSQGRRLYPGGICKGAFNDVHPLQLNQRLGKWGVFHTFEPPKLRIVGSGAGAQTAVLWLWLQWLGPGTEKGPAPGGWGAAA